jgi:hypothetical protein
VVAEGLPVDLLLDLLVNLRMLLLRDLLMYPYCL